MNRNMIQICMHYSVLSMNGKQQYTCEDAYERTLRYASQNDQKRINRSSPSETPYSI